MAKHIWENLQNCFLLGAAEATQDSPEEDRKLQWKTCVIQSRRKPFVQLQFPSTLVKDTFVQNDNKTKYRKDSANIPPQENTRHF